MQSKTISLQESGIHVFYREQRPSNPEAKVILLLHGFPSSSHQFRHLIPLLATRFRVIAPDLPGFGFTKVPNDFMYTFEYLTSVVAGFLDALEISRFSMYIFDYGAPTGLRLALQRPQAIEAIISQNGNAYEAGFGDVWSPIQDLWANQNSQADRLKVKNAMLTLEMTKFQYENGTPNLEDISPESYTLDYALMERPGNKDIQLDLFYDYRNNVAKYKEFQEYFRSSQVPLLAIWGKNDVFFIPAGAEAYKKDLPKATVKLLDAGHFATESHPNLIADEILQFLK